MRNYNLHIAGYKIRLESSENGPELVPEGRFKRNIRHEGGYDILIRIHTGKYNLPEEAERIFVAPYVVEIKGIKIKKRDNFWSVYKHYADLFIATNFPDSNPEKKAFLKLSLTARVWDLWLEGAGYETDPLEYPLDGLVLYYLTAINDDIMIHASGINYDCHGYIFSGVSGKGKTTMARLWDNLGARVIHDDRLIIRNIDGTYRMFNTPVYKNDVPGESPLDKIFLIEHCHENKIVPVKGASAVSRVVSNCIQHNYNPEMIARFLGSVSIMCSVVPVSTLYFKPDRSIIDYILRNE